MDLLELRKEWTFKLVVVIGKCKIVLWILTEWAGVLERVDYPCFAINYTVSIIISNTELLDCGQPFSGRKKLTGCIWPLKSWLLKLVNWPPVSQSESEFLYHYNQCGVYMGSTSTQKLTDSRA